VAAPRRGHLPAPPLRLSTVYPLGLFRAWATLTPEAAVTVFPRPSASAPPLAEGPGHAQHDGETARRRAGGAEDFDGLDRYRPGDAMQHIAWKAFSKGRGLMVKRFSTAVGGSWYVDWSTVPAADVEQRLSMLCAMVLQADRLGLAYGLVLPGVDMPPSAGPGHRFRCLRALALFGLGRDGS
jgi:uncharacterized protein (DUF58 family)